MDFPVTLIISDGWSANAHIDKIDRGTCTYEVIVHQENFVSPGDNTIHTQTIEGTWMYAKKMLRNQLGSSYEKFSSYMQNSCGRNILKI